MRSIHWLPAWRLIISCIVTGCLLHARPASAGLTILDYPAPAVMAAGTAYTPEVFAASAVSEQQAVRIAESWKTEPVTLPWTSLMLSMFVKHKIAPTRAARGSALMHVAMFDAWQLADDDPARRIAVSTAAASVLAYLFPEEEHGFDRVVGALTRQFKVQRGVSDAQLKRALQLGRHVGQRVIARGESDGAARGWNGIVLEWYGEGRYLGPGAWEPTPPYFYYPPNEPFAPTWKTWYAEIDKQVRPVPPAFGSPRFVRDLQELVDIQQKLSAEQVRIAKFWVDGSGSVTPPGHWNQIAIELVRKKQLDETQVVRLFAVLNIALADTFIAVWDIKYHYWTARPVTMAKVVLGIQVKPAILTPPFPSYVSGHAAFSGAAAMVIGATFPEEAGQLNAMAEEAALSRLYGGIHYRHDNEDGLAVGRSVAAIVMKKM